NANNGSYFQIFEINPSNGAIISHEIKINDKSLCDLTLKIDSRDNLNCVGFYSKLKDGKKQNNGIMGLFFGILNNVNGKFDNINWNDFDVDKIQQLEGKKSTEKENGLNKYFSLRYLLEKENGGFSVLMEENYTRIRNVYQQNMSFATNPNSMNSRTFTRDKIYGDVVVPRKSTFAQDILNSTSPNPGNAKLVNSMHYYYSNE